MTIEYADLINCMLEPVGDNDVFRFPGGSGETIRVQLTGAQNSGHRACFELFDPDGVRLGSVVCANSGADYLLEQTGTHTVLVSERFNDQTVAFGLLLERIDPTSPAGVPIESNQVIGDELNGVGDADVVFFAGEAGDTVRLQLSGARNSGHRACFQVYAPDGGAVASLVCANSSADYQLELTGRYTVLLTERFNDQAVGYTLSHACIVGSCAGGGLRPLAVAGCLVVKGTPLRDTAVRLRQPDEAARLARTDVRGCFRFEQIVQGKPFDLEVEGADVTE